jgi:serine/threonine protein kinase
VTVARETPFTAASADRTGSTQPSQVMPEMASVTVASCALDAGDCSGREDVLAHAADTNTPITKTTIALDSMSTPSGPLLRLVYVNLPSFPIVSMIQPLTERLLNHYRLIRPLGVGGMGEVYLAEDTRLKRQVAIKILSAMIAGDSDRRERFEREAQTVAALNHPNIVTLYSVEQSGVSTSPGQSETHFLTMEYLDGRTLADVMPKGGMAPIRLLGIARQIVEAVIAAHDRGIVHRDLKPANVMVMANDRVKVLDFGLAKLREPEDAALAAALPTRELTGEGAIVGTVSYMSPEQAEGRPIDGRSDIFALGVILYELAAGERPFCGETSLSVLSSILKDTPRDLTAVNPSLPTDLSRVVRRALAKDPERRYQAAKDLRNDLAELESSLQSGEPSGTPILGWTRRGVWPFAAAGAAVAVIAVLAAVWPRSVAERPTSAPPATSHSQLTQGEGVERFSRISPDGKWVVYNSQGDIYLQSVTGQTAITLTKDSPANDTTPAFSPDGETIAFRSERDGGGIFLMGLTGEGVRRLTTSGYQPAWFPDGRQIVFARGESGMLLMPGGRSGFSELWVVSASGGDPRLFFGGDAVQPSVSPHGKRVAFWSLPSDQKERRLALPGTAANRDIWTIDVNGEHPVRVTTHDANDWNPVWAPDGRWLYFLSNRGGSMNLWRTAIDEASGIAEGEPQAITAPAPYVADFSLSADGRIAAYSSILVTNNIGRVAFDPRTGSVKGPVEAVTAGTGNFAGLDVTRDGRWLVAGTPSRGREDLYIVSSAGGALRELTHDFARDRSPRWSSDGRQIFFYSDRRGFQLWAIDADGGGLRALTNRSEGQLGYPVPSRDGIRVAAVDQDARQVLIYDSADFSKPTEILPAFPDATASFTWPSDWSPDGRLLAATGQGGRGGVWVYSFDARAYRRVADGSTARWLSDGRRLIYQNGGRLFIVDTASGVAREVLAIPGETLAQAALTADDSQLYFTHGATSGDIWLMRLGEQ